MKLFFKNLSLSIYKLQTFAAFSIFHRIIIVFLVGGLFVFLPSYSAKAFIFVVSCCLFHLLYSVSESLKLIFFVFFLMIWLANIIYIFFLCIFITLALYVYFS
jgi:hypothetical protein